jgi:hypothetical protein
MMPGAYQETARSHLAADEGLTISVFTAEPGSPSEQALDLLASWVAPGLRI